MKVKIGNKVIQKNSEPFIVAEAGINHNGSLENAFKMIEAAKNAGADAVKFQTFSAEEFVGDPNMMYTYKSQGKEITEPLLDILKKCEFTVQSWKKIKQKCDKEKIIFFSTAQNRSDLDLLLDLEVPAIKVGSDDFTNIPQLKDYTSTGLPLILSCGMANLDEVTETLESVGAFENYPVVLLLCTSLYPAPPDQVNLKKFDTLSSALPDIPLGYSDHTIGSLASSVAVAFGACMFEKHFTLDRNMPGPDHWFAEDPKTLSEYVANIKKSYQMLGSEVVKPTAGEEKMKIIARRSIMTLQEIKKDEIFNTSNLGLRRPGNGLPPKMYENIIGLKASRDIPKGTLIGEGDFQ